MRSCLLQSGATISDSQLSPKQEPLYPIPESLWKLSEFRTETMSTIPTCTLTESHWEGAEQAGAAALGGGTQEEPLTHHAINQSKIKIKNKELIKGIL